MTDHKNPSPQTRAYPTPTEAPPVEQAPQPVAWRWTASSGMSAHMFDKPEPSEGLVITPLYEHPAPTEAPPVEQAPQPVAWRYCSGMNEGPWLVTTDHRLAEVEQRMGNSVEPLYAAPSEAPPVESQAADPVALAHISTTDDEVIADLEVLDGTFFQPKMTPVPLYIKPQVATKPTCGPDIIDAAKDLKRIVEGIDGTMKHGTWRDDHGNRLKDTTEWVRLYNAASSAGYVLVPLEPTAAMMEAVNGDMAEQRATHIHIFSADVWAAMVRAALAAEGSAE